MIYTLVHILVQFGNDFTSKYIVINLIGHYIGDTLSFAIFDCACEFSQNQFDSDKYPRLHLCVNVYSIDLTTAETDLTKMEYFSYYDTAYIVPGVDKG